MPRCGTTARSGWTHCAAARPSLVNTNKMLKTYRGITGLKTGTTGKAGVCISASAERDGLRLIAVVLGAASGKERFAAATALLDYGFANYESAAAAAAWRRTANAACGARHGGDSPAELRKAPRCLMPKNRARAAPPPSSSCPRRCLRPSRRGNRWPHCSCISGTEMCSYPHQQPHRAWTR